MTKKIIPLADYITAKDAACLLSEKLGRRIDPSYVRKLKNMRRVLINATQYLYNRHDIMQVQIRQKKRSA